MMNSKVYFFYGTNVYALRSKLNKWKTEFIQKFGADSVFHFSPQNRDQWHIRQALYGAGLFVSQKLVILEGVPRDASPENSLLDIHIEAFFWEFMEHVASLDSNTLVIFVSYKPDKRTKNFKRLTEHLEKKNLQEFSNYRIPELKTFIKEELSPLSMNAETMDYFISFVGEDLYRIVSELEKLKFSLSNKKTQISIEDIDRYCFSMVEANGFTFFDMLFSDPLAAVRLIEKLQNERSFRLQVQGLLLRGLKADFLVLESYQSGMTEAKAIISATKLAPFVVYGRLKRIDALIAHQDFLREFIIMLVETDYNIKSGKIPLEFFWLKVKEKVLELLP